MRWGSSVYVQKKSRSLTSRAVSGRSSFAEPLALALTLDGCVAVEEADMAH